MITWKLRFSILQLTTMERVYFPLKKRPLEKLLLEKAFHEKSFQKNIRFDLI